MHVHVVNGERGTLEDDENKTNHEFPDGEKNKTTLFSEYLVMGLLHLSGFRMCLPAFSQ
jgi:hypothetical protein